MFAWRYVLAFVWYDDRYYGYLCATYCHSVTTEPYILYSDCIDVVCGHLLLVSGTYCASLCYYMCTGCIAYM